MKNATGRKDEQPTATLWDEGAMKQTAHQLAIALIGGSWDRDALEKRIADAVNIKNFSALKLAAHLELKYKGRSPHSVKDLKNAILESEHFTNSLEKTHGKTHVHITPQPFLMRPSEKFKTWPLPKLQTKADLAAFLDVTEMELDWFADTYQRQKSHKHMDEQLHHYFYLWRERRNKTPRLIESPKTRLKAIQRKILLYILNKVPPHDAAHGFCPKRSIITHAQNHIGKDVVLSMDLKNFFHAVPVPRIRAIFGAIGYPRHITQLLTGLCTHHPSSTLLGNNLKKLSFLQRKHILKPHLPQGAPTSPMLANLCCWNLDTRLEALAQKMGLSYSRYADDITFSGDYTLKENAAYLRGTITGIAKDEGFAINTEKTRLMTSSQRQIVTGIVVNDKMNIARVEYDRLKAELHSLSVGKTLPTKEDYLRLAGKIAHCTSLNKTRGAKLSTLFDKIDWDQSASKL